MYRALAARQKLEEKKKNDRKALFDRVVKHFGNPDEGLTIRGYLCEHCVNNRDCDMLWDSPTYSGDNTVVLCLEHMEPFLPTTDLR